MTMVNLKALNAETKLFMPNEIFGDLASCKELVGKETVSPHISFAYSYIWLSYWLYRTCQWNGDVKVTQDVMKSILGYSMTNKTLNFIIKKDGVVDRLGYTATTTDYPHAWHWDGEFISFQTSDEFKMVEFKEHGYKIPNYLNDRNFKIKYPIKAFHRTIESFKAEVLDGTFYDAADTHYVPFEVFKYCMEHQEIGVTGFYLYAFLKSQNDVHKAGAQFSRGRLEEETGIKESTLDKYLGRMQEHNMIDVDVADVVINSPIEDREANTYRVKNVHSFGKTGELVIRRKVYYHKQEEETVQSNVESRVLEPLPF